MKKRKSLKNEGKEPMLSKKKIRPSSIAFADSGNKQSSVVMEVVNGKFTSCGCKTSKKNKI
jgi:hypothetical protein